MKVIGISDVSGAYYRKDGIDMEAAERHANQHGSLAGFDGAEAISPDDLLTLPCDVLVPAAVEGVITEHNAGRLRCRILAEGANGPTTPAADRILFERWNEIFVIPDILCNAGGVIVSYFEWVQGMQSFFWSETEVMDRLFRILEQAFTAVIKRARDAKIPHRMSAMAIGVERVLSAKRVRGLFP
jgi:glutamate dehydrogenase (NAD(P)+)